MSADIVTTATQLAILVAGRDPSWTAQTVAGSDMPPKTANDGIPLLNAPRSLVRIQLREEPHRRTARLSIPTLVIGNIFTVTIDGTAVIYDSTGDVDLDEVLTSIAGAINANGTVNQIVLATPDTVNDLILLQGLTSADYSVDFTDNGASVEAVVADMSEATARLWWTVRGASGVTPPADWVASPVDTLVPFRGYVERFDTAGLARGFIELVDRTGAPLDGVIVTFRDPVLHIGPAVLEA